MISKPTRFLLYAPNIHTGGGFVLLQALLDAWPQKQKLVAWLDERARERINLPVDNCVEWVCPTIRSRLMAEFLLAKTARQDDQILCFHGLPPLLPNNGALIVYQQNRIYFGQVSLKTFDWRTRIRLRLEQCISRLFRHRIKCYYVQTPSMARSLQSWYGVGPVDIRILSFALPGKPSDTIDSVRWDFVYLADGEAHKNHRCLVEAWKLLARDGIKPSLALTLSNRDAALITWIKDQVGMHDLRITNLGHLLHSNALALYYNSRALIFPSLSESFGLPLIEAREVGLPILAGELDFVRDVCVPIHSFDPGSPVSIARAVKRFLGQDVPPMRVASASEFLHDLMTKHQ